MFYHTLFENAASVPSIESDGDETRNSPRIRRNKCYLRLRRDVQDALDQEGRPARRNLLGLPPVLHRQTKAGRYRWTRRSLQQALRQETSDRKRSFHTLAITNPDCRRKSVARSTRTTPLAGIFVTTDPRSCVHQNEISSLAARQSLKA